MKLLFNLDVIEGNRVKTQAGDYLKSLPVDQQIAAVTGLPTGLKTRP